ncbi:MULTISPECIES: acetylglutamate/acetylaminoadipate kinase [Haloferax]|jgi:acetylglutamate/LysW-gamma-L-alpha-aminoadipate kinase|uniref:Putative [LysW]-aminoadipate/[LysW]-glutamate kinase n=1 Tax=Haloferax volcanii JCM 10717 TaxID=1227458 RepID=M0I465_HALVO|nr:MULTISPECIES: acetylglutamate/acetylaminoadipate kinase [Haloferax]ELZ90818.1 acetylglutamate/acetylaminoadipate kinase [Haloferax alexandrinus JCM 10717]MBC9984871.1 acetylglutamate/acetylaminoadipate kinase [Haloferax sp. AS1]RDZ36625.1 acetylglutamate kinase [Haloferax sp. Atlit-24N]RLM37423.1 acetylglutamate/acetylaminoadipate kinase [Haloferax sp. Atlit-109R]RLM45363.1 acetylglutamate/acetylaminoadipate kinase [Haloferax sp. Atlit-105R]
MTGYTREELLAAHEQLVDNEDNLIADGGIGIGDSGTSSALRADGGKEPPVVVKIGGAKAVDPKGAVSDVAHLVANGTDVVVVHGGSTAVDETLEELGEEPTYVESPSGVSGRFTDERTMEVFSMVMPGKLNTDLTALFREAGVDALGLSGVDGGLLTGPRKSAVRVVEDGKKKIKRGDHSGKITSVNATLLETLLDGGYTPIVTVPMLADDGVPVNADADRAAAAVAGALGAKLVVLTDVKGVYADPDDESTLIETADTPEAFSALESAAEGFMTKKVMAAKEALDGGAAEVVVSDANLNDPIVTALNGGGTHVTPGALVEAEEAEQ